MLRDRPELVELVGRQSAIGDRNNEQQLDQDARRAPIELPLHALGKAELLGELCQARALVVAEPCVSKGVSQRDRIPWVHNLALGGLDLLLGESERLAK